MPKQRARSDLPVVQPQRLVKLTVKPKKASLVDLFMFFCSVILTVNIQTYHSTVEYCIRHPALIIWSQLIGKLGVGKVLNRLFSLLYCDY